MTIQRPRMRAAALALAAAVLTLGASALHAQTSSATTMRVPNGPLFGLVSVLPTQSLRVSLANDAFNVTSPLTPPNPIAPICTANVALIDQTGATFASATATVAAGANTTLNATDFTAVGGLTQLCNGIDNPSVSALCAGSIPNLPAAAPDGRARFRPVIDLTGPAGVPTASACGTVKMSVQIIDTATGRTDLLTPPNPIHPLSSFLAAILARFQPSDPVFSFIGTVATDVAQVSLSNTNKTPSDPVCPATVSFVDNTGATLASKTMTLVPGASDFLTVAGGSPLGVLTLRPVVHFPPSPSLSISPFLPFTGFNPSDPCRGVVAIAELSSAGKTRIVMNPSDPIRLLFGF